MQLDQTLQARMNHRRLAHAYLLTGRDLMDQLKGKDLGTRLLISETMLRHGETVFLDDMTVEELSQGLGVEVPAGLVGIGGDGLPGHHGHPGALQQTLFVDHRHGRPLLSV